MGTNSTLESDPIMRTTPSPSTTTLMPTGDIQSVQTTLFELETRITEVEGSILILNESYVADINQLTQEVDDLDNNETSDGIVVNKFKILKLPKQPN